MAFFDATNVRIKLMYQTLCEMCRFSFGSLLCCLRKETLEHSFFSPYRRVSYRILFPCIIQLCQDFQSVEFLSRRLIMVA